MLVRVKYPGVYLGPTHRALPPASDGDLIDIADGPYAAGVIDDGFVEPVAPALVPETPKAQTTAVPEQVITAPAAPATKSKTGT